jgi:uncharacterized protein (DUF924 family)
MITPDQILAFWFPPGLDADEDTHRRQFLWWLRGGADQAILERYGPALKAACRGALDHWADAARSRLALIIVLDQFSRTVYRNSAKAFAQDDKAAGLTIGGLERGHYAELTTVWEKTFFVLPLGHSEQIALQRRGVALCEALVAEAPERLRPIYAFSASQARGHCDVIARFGRHPHRNAALGRTSTEAERAYLAAGDLVHQRAFRGRPGS